MYFARKVFSVLLVLVAATCALAQSSPSQTPDLNKVLARDLSRHCDDPRCIVEFLEGDFASGAFYDLLLTTELPGGMATLPDYTEESKNAFKPASSRFSDLLNSLVFAEPRYRWTVAEGVINLAPAGGYPMLNTVIAEFSAQDANVTEMIDILRHHPDFESAVKRFDFSRPKAYDNESGFGFGGGGVPVPPSKRISIHLNNLTVQQVLNEIVRREGCGIWQYSESSFEGKHFFQLSIGSYCTGQRGTDKLEN